MGNKDKNIITSLWNRSKRPAEENEQSLPAHHSRSKIKCPNCAKKIACNSEVCEYCGVRLVYSEGDI